jgi:hypothetical protein
MERSIKLFSNRITGTVLTGINASNVLKRELNFQRYFLRCILKQVFPPATYSAESFMYNPSGDRVAPQLWEPFNVVKLNSNEQTICEGIQREVVIDALKSYHKRLDQVETVELSDNEIKTAAYMWCDSIKYPSDMSVRFTGQRSRLNNMMIFEAGIGRRYILSIAQTLIIVVTIHKLN